MSQEKEKGKNVRSGEIPVNCSVWGKRVERARVFPNFYIWMQKFASSFWSLGTTSLVKPTTWKAGVETTLSALVSSYHIGRKKNRDCLCSVLMLLFFSIFSSFSENFRKFSFSDLHVPSMELSPWVTATFPPTLQHYLLETSSIHCPLPAPHSPCSVFRLQPTPGSKMLNVHV